MKSDLKTRHGGRILADALVAQGVKMAFGVPGESYLPLLDGLLDVRDKLSFVMCRQEGGASYMAEAYGKLTGEPGVLLVTRGPGATNGAIGTHTGFRTRRRWWCSSARCPTSSPSARPFRKSITGACTARWRSGWRRSTASSASRSP